MVLVGAMNKSILLIAILSFSNFCHGALIGYQRTPEVDGEIQQVNLAINSFIVR